MALVRSTTNGDYVKYSSAIEKLINKSMYELLPVQHGAKKKKYIIKLSEGNKQALKDYIATVPSDAPYALNKIFLETEDGSKINFGSLEKPKIRKISNRGDVAEAILASSLYTTIRYNEKIDLHRLYSVVDTFKPTSFGNISKIDLTGYGVGLFIALAEPHMNTFMDRDLWFNELKGLSDASLHFANSDYVSDKIDENALILVNADGVGQQLNTKTDISVIDDGLPIINISLKVGGVKQFGQQSGLNFSNYQFMFSKMDIDILHLQEEYNHLLTHDVISAFRLIYNYVSEQEIDTGSLIKFIRYYATLNESDVIMVNLVNKANVYDFERLELLTDYEIHSIIKHDKMNKPKLIIKAGDMDIVQIRMKIENKIKGFYVRNYVEMGNGLRKLLEVKI